MAKENTIILKWRGRKVQIEKALEIKIQAVTQWIEQLEDGKKRDPRLKEILDLKSDLLADYQSMLQEKLDDEKRYI